MDYKINKIMYFIDFLMFFSDDLILICTLVIPKLIIDNKKTYYYEN